MKKFILLTILMLGFLTNVQAQESDTLKTTIYKDVKSAITQLADALKVGAEHVYGVLVTQQVVESITTVIVYIICLSFSIFLFWNGSRLLKLQEERGKSDINDDTIGWNFIPGVLLSFCLLIYFFFTINSTVTGFVNPEYGAIQEIMNLIR